QPGSVILGAAAWQQVQPAGQSMELAAGAVPSERVRSARPPAPLPPLPLTDDMVPFLLGYTPAAIHRRLAARQSGWLAEMRRLTVLFVNLPQLHYATPLARSQEVMQALQTELYRYEGSINKLSVDDKGVTLVAALGLP